MHLLITRPDTDAQQLKDRLAEMGHTGILSPLLTITFAKGQIPLNGVQALVATSRNALRALGRSPSLAKAVKLPIFTVGSGSGAMAAELGFERILSGPASARELITLIEARAEPSGRPLVVLRGDRQAFDMKGALEGLGFSATQKIVYRTVAAERLPPSVIEGIDRSAIDGVILMSPRTAEVFMRLSEEAGLADAIPHLHFFCISPAVAKRLGPISPSICHIAEKPNLEEILALIDRMAAKSH